MKFKDHYTFIHFKKVSVKNIIDDEFRLQLEACDRLYIPDEIYFLLDDSFSAYLNEVKYHSRRKKFFKELANQTLTRKNLPNLTSLLTHVMLGYTRRLSIRSNVDSSSLILLKEDIMSIIDTILSKGESKNKLYNVLIK